MARTKSEWSAGVARRPTYDELLAENTQLKQRVARLTAEVRRLTALVDRLTVALDEERRRGKRQAAPFRKQDEPAPEPKKPGRKSGRRHGPHAHRGLPPRIDETYHVPLPSNCPHCGSRHVSETHVAVQYQTEIPRQVIYRQFDVHVGRCGDCGQAVEGRHALQTSSARGAAASQLGANVHALLAIWIDATNFRGEQAIRPAVVNRKVWGGNRTWQGAYWQSILMSVIHTCEQRGANAFAFLLAALRQPTAQILPD